MPPFHAIAEKVRQGLPLPRHWDLLLRAATPLTRLGMAHRLRQPVSAVEAHVVSFGNITTGGTGKTPAVIARVQDEIAAGHRVAVITRGYGSARVVEPYVVEPTMNLHDVARLVGDEPALIRHRAPECLVIKAARRVDGARLAVETYSCDRIILDDAYQHVQLARDENICLIDASNPFGSGHLLPRGILREPLEALNRATELIITRCDQAEDLPGLRRRLKEYVPHLPVRETMHAAGRLWNLRTGETLSPAPGLSIRAVAAIGNPEAFLKTLTALDLDIADVYTFPDHRQISRAALTSSDPIITTEKDAMRIVDPPDNLYALEIILKDWKES